MRISIVTPSFNQRDYLQQTLDSVLSQQGDFELQHVVVDGQSTDGTIELLQGIKDSRVSWTSQMDKGQSDAINRGLRHADGDIIGWLNSDDLYCPDALKTVTRAFADPKVNWVVGRYQIIDQHGQSIRRGIVNYKNRFLDSFTYRKLLRENFIAQPAVFWRGDFGKQIGGLDESLHYTMDYDLWLRMARAFPPLVLRETLAQFRIHPNSKSGKVKREQFDEGYRVADRYFGQDHVSRWIHRFNVQKIVWAYQVMRLFRR